MTARGKGKAAAMTARVSDTGLAGGAKLGPSAVDAAGAAGAHVDVSLRRVADLKPFERNAKTHPQEQVVGLAASIEEFGWTKPVLVDENDGIVAGHGAVLAATYLYANGKTIPLPGGRPGDADRRFLPVGTVPVIVCRGWTDEQRRAYIIADNQHAANSGWDDGLLKVEMTDLKAIGFDLATIGFDKGELDEMFRKPSEPVRDPGITYKENFAVLVACADEAEQARVYDKLQAEGYSVKVLVN